MEERGGGTSSRQVRDPGPDEVRVWGKTKSYDIHLIPAQGVATISTTDYHPGELALTLEDLEALAEALREG